MMNAADRPWKIRPSIRKVPPIAPDGASPTSNEPTIEKTKPSINILTRPTLSARQLGDELIVDIERYSNYPGCRALFCLVYDPKELISNPGELEGDLSGQRDKLAVRVMIVPTQS